MQSDSTLQPAPPMSLFHTIPPSRMIFISSNETESSLANTLHAFIHLPLTSGHLVWLLVSQLGCLLALAISLFLIVKKRSIGKLWLVSRKATPYGSFYLTNATFCLVVGVAVYLVGWTLISAVVAAFSFAGKAPTPGCGSYHYPGHR